MDQSNHEMHAHHHHSPPDMSASLESAANPISQSFETEHVHDHSSSMGHMAMSFHFGCSETILFDQWKISSVPGLLTSLLGIFFLAALYEGLKYYREYLFWKTYNELHYRSIPAQQSGSSIEENKDTAKVVPPCDILQKQPPALLMLSMPHLTQTFLHVLQVTLSFFLMLIFMTYNVWLCTAVVLGAGCGYFLFGWKKSVIVDVTEHCH